MSFIKDYLLTTQGSKPCQEYHIAVMLSTLSAFAGRRFWFPFGPLTFYPNIYTGLVGEPGMAKSTAMNRGKNIVRAAGVCPVAATQISKEALTQQMSSTIEGKPKKVPFAGQKRFQWGARTIEYNQYAIYATELVEFIAINPQGFLDFLTTVWDEPIYEVETKNRGSDLIVGPYITMVACMTPEKLKGYLKLAILTGGFARRTMWWFSNTKNIVHWPTYTQEQQEAEARCIAFGKALQGKSGEFVADAETCAYYEAWNQKNEEVLRDRPPCMRGWFEGKGEMLWKLSMLIALAEEAGEDRVIRLPYYRLALHYCSLMEVNYERVFEGTGVNPSAAAATQICRMLEAMDRPMNKKHIEAMFFDQVPSLNELRDTIVHLVSVGRLAEKTLTDNGTLLGTVLGTPSSLTRYNDAQLRTFLKRPVVPPDELEAGSNSTAGQSSPPDSPQPHST